MAPQNERTEERPANYSKWHRYPNLPHWCHHTDGDWFEQRKCEGEFPCVAYIETIELPPDEPIERAQYDYPLWQSKGGLMDQVEQGMQIPCFVVRHTEDCSLFSVAQVTNKHEGRAIVMNEDEYKDFIQNLKPAYPCPNCGGTDWWLRSNGEWHGDWLCGRCNPNPNAPEITSDTPLNEPFEVLAK